MPDVQITSPLEDTSDQKKAVPVVVKDQPIAVTIRTNPVPVTAPFLPEKGWTYVVDFAQQTKASFDAMAQRQQGLELVPIFAFVAGAQSGDISFLWRKPSK